MPFKVRKNTAHASDASGVVSKLSDTTRAAAQRHAWRDPKIRSFVYCHDDVQLPAGLFRKGDAVFFSGEPKPAEGSAATDLLVKDFFVTGYSVVNRPGTLSDLACYQLSDGTPLFDFAIISAARFKGSVNAPDIYVSDDVAAVLSSGGISALQDLGVIVLLSVAGASEPAGWSTCPNDTVARSVAQQLMDVVTQYNLDGIDIDDEYSSGDTNNTSMIMVVDAFRQMNPYYWVTKALFEDSTYFTASWNGITLAQLLSYGWEMYYGDSDCTSLLSPYVANGMSAWQLAGGADAGETGSPSALANCIVNNNYGGMMVWKVGDATTSYLSDISNALFNSATTTPDGCLSTST
ncbi:MAG TPA: glycosyl hydrolase family 18 protein [Thermoanaerobaculia bacterium]|nr:glycosyl hydrolase family 18 protein [Thermoanaerobaculia bacterium]